MNKIILFFSFLLIILTATGAIILATQIDLTPPPYPNLTYEEFKIPPHPIEVYTIPDLNKK